MLPPYQKMKSQGSVVFMTTLRSKHLMASRNTTGDRCLLSSRSTWMLTASHQFFKREREREQHLNSPSNEPDPIRRVGWDHCSHHFVALHRMTLSAKPQPWNIRTDHKSPAANSGMRQEIRPVAINPYGSSKQTRQPHVNKACWLRTLKTPRPALLSKTPLRCVAPVLESPPWWRAG